MSARRKCFISYHHADQDAVDAFVRTFDHSADCFISRGLGEELPGDVIASNNTDYIMKQIRERFIADSTVTIVMIGACTWARKFVDWEIGSSLRNTALSNANGLLGIKLPTAGRMPARFNDNLKHEGMTDCYARWMAYPQTTAALERAVEEAYQHRQTHSALINNHRDRMLSNFAC